MELLLAPKYRQTRYVILIATITACLQFLLSYGSVGTMYNIVFMAGLVPITLITCLVFVYKLIPKYVLTNELIPFVTWSLATILGCAVLTLTFLLIVVGFVPGLTVDQMPSTSRNYPFLLTAIFSIVVLVSFVSLWKHRQLALVEQLNLEKKLAENDLVIKKQELDALKSQLHPHFLFNSLNTIYSLALRQAKETPETILKLSDLLDYTLYQVNQPIVALNKETDHLTSYIDLEKTRFEDTLKVHFETEIDREDYEIAPMLLMPFVENAFKHGKVVSVEQLVEAHLSVDQDLLRFSIQNTCLNKAYQPGLGLKNVQKRLEMLYPKRHVLNIVQEADMFKVNLEISGLKPTVHE
ncbi:sensor histidine kinase [Roseivirga sp. E12]|uniref:sensor histidine kinase n=1 Tax=Roseivirga sp. E12 TaxID=2819237 RepID=UPI001ABCF7E7|nr:histidine kinase [Roseivirga sp. E12]MBO3697945.1 histidine kinase [Roseivirga sp. E12]